jgi:hypothetical protein
MGYVLMAIPAELVAPVTEFIESHEPDGLGEAGSGSPPDRLLNGWERSTVRRAYRESGDNMRRLLDFMANSPGREISSYELADSIEARYGWNTVAGMLGAFGRRSANRYGLDQPMWALRYDADGRVLLTMPSDTAEALREAQRE